MYNVEISGRLTRDFQVKNTSNGKMVASCGLAYNYSKDSCEFFDLTAWEEIAQKVQYFKKGQGVELTGYVTEKIFNNKKSKQITIKTIDAVEFKKKDVPITNQLHTGIRDPYKSDVINDQDIPF